MVYIPKMEATSKTNTGEDTSNLNSKFSLVEMSIDTFSKKEEFTESEKLQITSSVTDIIEPLSFSREFIFIDSFFSQNTRVFTSEDALNKYNLFKNSKDGDQFQTSAALHAQGLALPLLEFEYKYCLAFGKHEYMSVFRFRPPSKEESRLFNKKVDKYLFCSVERTWYASYYKYRLKFYPNPQDSTNSFEIILIHHYRNQIVDTSIYNGTRYRWIHSYSCGLRQGWKYALQVLDNDKPSLSDGMLPNGEVANDNPLLGSNFANLILPRRILNNSSFASKVDIGTLLDFKTFLPQPQAKAAIFQFQDNVPINIDSITDVSIDALVFICMSSIIKRVEKDKEASNG
ncbi:hypothetical protein CAAN1_21S02740 [[Candida] anglica]|uniref:Uncharacterized protein n=1 Tax=[Candida] anglica TaxID=148631 RepID=A0ABP0EE67_9ASCO